MRLTRAAAFRSFAGCLLALSLTGPALAQPRAATVLELAAQQKNLNTFVAAVHAAGLDDTLKAAGPITVYAPTDEAFAKLPAAQREALMNDPARLKALLLGHVVNDMIKMRDGDSTITSGSVAERRRRHAVVRPRRRAHDRGRRPRRQLRPPRRQRLHHHDRQGPAYVVRRAGHGVVEWSVMLSARDLWIDEKARRAGYENGAALASSHGLKSYRIDQLYRAATKELVDDLDAITTLPKELRAAFAAEGFALDSIEPVVIQRSNDGQTTKGLFRLHDGNEVEAVLMEHHGERNTVCISSQAGCAYACTFCSTGQAGFSRNLTATEIFDQARYFAKQLAREGRKITNVVFMGQGEPFANFEPVMGAVALLNDPEGLRPGPPAHHDLHRRTGRQDRPLRRRADASEPRDLAARADRRDALDDHAGEPQVLHGGADGGGRALHPQDEPQGVLRVRDARGRQRHRPARARPRAPDERPAVPRQPDPVQQHAGRGGARHATTSASGSSRRSSKRAASR